MDHVMIEKLHAMKRYKRKKNYLHNITTSIIIFSLLGLFLSCPLWIPMVQSLVVRSFLSTKTAVLGPKCLFLMCNVIVAFLVNESKRVGTSKPEVDNLYEEYTRRNKRNIMKVIEKQVTIDRQDEESIMEREEEEMVEEQYFVGEETIEEEEEEEELKQRCEDFIARVNHQRMMEARMLVCSG